MSKRPSKGNNNNGRRLVARPPPPPLSSYEDNITASRDDVKSRGKDDAQQLRHVDVQQRYYRSKNKVVYTKDSHITATVNAITTSSPLITINTKSAKTRTGKKQRKSGFSHVVLFAAALLLFSNCLVNLFIHLEVDELYHKNNRSHRPIDHTNNTNMHLVHNKSNVSVNASKSIPSLQLKSPIDANDNEKDVGKENKNTTEKETPPYLPPHSFPPRKISNTTNPIYFLHVGKAGGTSFDSLIPGQLRKAGCTKKYYGSKHYDWSWIQQMERRRMGIATNSKDMEKIGGYEVSANADVITFLRHPVSRAVSQFYFSKKLSWSKKFRFGSQTLENYLVDPNKDWWQAIEDGESGTNFLAGIFSTDKGCWVASDGQEPYYKEYLRHNQTAAAIFAARRLERTTFFGIIEDLDRSMKLLQVMLGLKETPVMPKSNSARGEGNPHPSENITTAIEKFIPKDMWLYEYAKRLFDARWDYFMGEHKRYIAPDLPPLPIFDNACQSDHQRCTLVLG